MSRLYQLPKLRLSVRALQVGRATRAIRATRRDRGHHRVHAVGIGLVATRAAVGPIRDHGRGLAPYRHQGHVRVHDCARQVVHADDGQATAPSRVVVEDDAISRLLDRDRDPERPHVEAGLCRILDHAVVVVAAPQ